MFSESQLDLIKVKRSYIQYMDQINRMYGYPRNYIGVLFTLIMEKDKELTQNQIMQLTGYSRSSISEVLSQLSEDLLISEVKMPGDRKKYYRANVDFEQYIQNFFIKVLRAPYTSLDFVPEC